MADVELSSIVGGGSASAEPSASPDVGDAGGDVGAPIGSTGETPSATPAQPVATAQSDDDDFDANDEHPVPRKALISERKKRQELERRLAETEGKIAVYSQYQSQMQQPQKLEPEVKKDDDLELWSDPKGYFAKQQQEVISRFESKLVQQSVAQVREANPDYDEAENAFVEVAKHNTFLQQQLREAPNPALFAYRHGKQFLEAQKYGGSIDEMRSKVRDELRSEVEAEVRKNLGLTAASTASRSNAGARGSGGAQTTPTFTARPLSALVGGRGKRG